MRKKFFFLGILLGVCLASPAQFYSARTNLIGLATGNINLEGSMTLNRRWSLHLPVQYNPFVFKDNRQFRNLTVMPGVRYWFVESYSNFFVGMNTLASGYSIGRIWNKKRYEGEGYGIGLSIGKAYPLSKTWNIEWGTRRRRGLGEVQRIPLPGMRRLPGQKTRMVSDTFTCGVEHDISFLNVRSYEKKKHTCNPFTSTAVLILFPVPQDGKEHQQGRSLTGRQAACTGHDMLFRSRKNHLEGQFGSGTYCHHGRT